MCAFIYNIIFASQIQKVLANEVHIWIKVSEADTRYLGAELAYVQKHNF